MRRNQIYAAALIAASFLTQSASFAADLPSRLKPTAKCPSAFSTLGGSLGAGRAFGASLVTLDVIGAGSADHNGSGAFLGARAGYRYNFDSGFFVGADIEGFGGNSENRMHCDLLNDSNLLTGTSQQRLHGFGSVGARVGYRANDVSVSLTGGPAFASIGFDEYYAYVDAYAINANHGFIVIFNTSDLQPAFTHQFHGWTLGASSSFDITARLSAVIDYKYYNFGKYTIKNTITHSYYATQIHPTLNLFTVGLRYSF